MPQPKQNLQNHARYVPLYHFVTFPILILVLVRAIQQARVELTYDTALDVALAAALGLVCWHARAFALSVQDRVIRLEMRLRMQAIAPEQAARFESFTAPQLTALRFAGDAELPGLAQQALEGKLASGAAIKREIRDWQADHWRA